MSEALVVIKNLTKTFSPKAPPALQGINAEIPKSEIVGLVGPDGAGKTTLIRLIAGLLKPTEGTITVSGYDSVKDVEQIRLLSGYMPQKFGLYEDLTVMQNLNLYADLRGLAKDAKEATFKKLLHFTALAPFTERLAYALSGGMKQKLGLACALVQKPTLLLLDEPSVGVDPISRRELWKMVSELVTEGITVLWNTAYLDEAEKCKNVLLISGGKLLYFGPPQELTKRVEGRVFKLKNIQGNRRALLARALATENVIDGVIQGSDVRIVLKKNAAPPSFEADIEPTSPRFEDAFIDILGGGPGGKSELAEKRSKASQTKEPPVDAKGLTKKFGAFTAVSKITFTVPQGEIFGLLGPNGAGKSTTFRMLCGLLHPTEGQAFVNGLNLESASGEARAHIGYMAQKFSLYGQLNVKENLIFFAGAYNLVGPKLNKAVDEMIKTFALKEFLGVTAETLPLGYKQRLALACANMHEPVVLFLDEPTSGMDPITRREFWNHINGLVEKGITVLVTTHFMDEAQYCDRIALIYRGQMIHLETPDALKAIAKTPENPDPTLEDAFVKLIEEFDAAHPQ